MVLAKHQFQIEIPKRGKVCLGCQKPFEKGDSFRSALIENEGWKRADYCVSCWEQLPQIEKVAFWHGVVPEQSDKVSLPKDKGERALLLLKEKSATPDHEREAFLLALYLLRKKLILLRKEVKNKEGEMLYLFEVAETEEPIAIKKVLVQPHEQPIFQQRLDALFSD